MTKPKALINTQKIRVLVICGVDGPVLVEIVPPNLRVSAKYLCEIVIPAMEAKVKTHRPEHGLKAITFRWDNAPTHTAKVTIAKISELGMNQMPDARCQMPDARCQIPHPPYSSDIDPCDFFLFWYLKHKFQGCSKDAPMMLLRLSR
jgi:histone-lysine N-methyltransferase SETMAR